MKKGNQTPTKSVVLPYKRTKGRDAKKLYNQTGRTCQRWQARQLNNILATNKEGLWVHTKYGYSVPRRNGKNEVVAMRELYGLVKIGERVLHTAHRTTTSHSAAIRLSELLDSLGYTEIQRMNKEKKAAGEYAKNYTFSKQFGLERIQIIDGGTCDFRTRSGKGGLGEGFDLLIIDEAQEYTDEQESALKYVVTDSKNPQTIFCGTPPTMVSSGTIFLHFRNDTLQGGKPNSGWAEWSVDEVSDIRDRKLWYLTNPSLGTIFRERSIEDEIGGDEMDFNIQRLGLWHQDNLKSAISKTEWDDLKSDKVPEAESRDLFVGVKFGKDGTNVALSIAFKAKDGAIFVEVVNCLPIRDGVGWIVDWLVQSKSVKKVAIDGANGQEMLANRMKEAKLKKPILPTVKEIITANALFEQAVYKKTIVHMGQEELANVVSNCEKRNIGSNGGFGYLAQMPDGEIALMDSVILAHWLAATNKGNKQIIKY